MGADQFGRSAPDRRSRARIAAASVAGVLALLGAGCTSSPKVAPPCVAAVTTLPLKGGIPAILENGEESVYKVTKGILPVGEVTYRVDHVEDAGTAMLRLESRTQAAAWLAAFVDIGGTTHSYVDRATLLPSSYYWVTSDEDDPLIRTASFDHATGRVFASSFQKKKCLTTRVIVGREIHDPVSSLLLARTIDFSRVQDEIRLHIVEGIDLHLMTLRLQGCEILDAGEPCAQPTQRIAMRTDRLDCHGNLVGEDPYNSLLMWVADAPPHQIVRIEGTVGGTALKLTLRKRTLTPRAESRPEPAASP
jgi:hypothetical protein